MNRISYVPFDVLGCFACPLGMDQDFCLFWECVGGGGTNTQTEDTK